jgi:hypothetical protein
MAELPLLRQDEKPGPPEKLGPRMNRSGICCRSKGPRRWWTDRIQKILKFGCPVLDAFQGRVLRLISCPKIWLTLAKAPPFQPRRTGHPQIQNPAKPGPPVLKPLYIPNFTKGYRYGQLWIPPTTINMVVSNDENDRGYSGSRLPSAQITRCKRRPACERIDPSRRRAGPETASAEARPEGETSARAIEGARHSPSRQCQNLRPHFFSLTSTFGLPSRSSGTSTTTARRIGSIRLADRGACSFADSPSWGCCAC